MLFGLTTLQQGMGGFAESSHPSDPPAVLGAPGAGWVSGAFGIRMLVVVGLVMTAVMQSSTASTAITLSAWSGDQFRNGGDRRERLAVAYIQFKVIATLIALVRSLSSFVCSSAQRAPSTA